MADPPHPGPAPAAGNPAVAANLSRRPWNAVVLGLAVLVSVPGVALAVAALAHILHAIATESWYRQLFLAYGVRLVVLYAAFAAGFASSFLLVSGRAGRAGRRARLVAIATAIAGLVAALLLEAEFWGEADGLAPHGWFAGPFVGWAMAAGLLRHRPAAPAGAPGT